MARLNEVIGKYEPDDLIVSASPSADVVFVTLAAGVGKVKRGAVIAGTPGGKDFAPLTAENGAGKALYILTDDADTKTDSPEGTETPVSVYRTGHFAREKVNEATGYTLTAADEENLRKSGILLSTLLEY